MNIHVTGCSCQSWELGMFIHEGGCCSLRASYTGASCAEKECFFRGSKANQYLYSASLTILYSINKPHRPAVLIGDIKDKRNRFKEWLCPHWSLFKKNQTFSVVSRVRFVLCLRWFWCSSDGTLGTKYQLTIGGEICRCSAQNIWWCERSKNQS